MSTLVELVTSKGTIRLELDEAKAPITVKNFVDYVNSGHYVGTVFHRVIKGFMVQCGGLNADMSNKPTRSPIQNEGGNGLSNKKYTLAMARTNAPHSATAQFFINVNDNKFLDASAGNAGYAVFGKVVAGTEVVDAIEGVATGNRSGHSDVPKDVITITAARVVQ